MAADKVTVTVDGIEVTVDRRALDDMGFVRSMTGLMAAQRRYSDAEDDDGRIDASLMLFDDLEAVAQTLFGPDLPDVEARFRAAHDGYMPFEAWTEFITGVIEAAQKNPDARPAAGRGR